MEWINAAEAVTGIIVAIAGAFYAIILKPLHKAIEDLSKAIGELRMELLTTEDRRHEMEKQLITIDNKANRAHERIDDLKKFCAEKRGCAPERKDLTGHERLERR